VVKKQEIYVIQRFVTRMSVESCDVVIILTYLPNFKWDPNHLILGAGKAEQGNGVSWVWSLSFPMLSPIHSHQPLSAYSTNLI